MTHVLRRLLALFVAGALLPALPAAAQDAAPPAVPHVQTPDEAIAQDAAEYARLFDVDQDEAVRRMQAQEASVAATDRLHRTYADRLAGIAIEHQPAYRIVVRLTGDEPVAPQVLRAGGLEVPISFITGARATQAQLVEAMRTHGAAARARLPGFEGMGVDQRSGELVLMLSQADDATRSQIEREAEAMTGMPVRARVSSGDHANLMRAGGSRVEGIDPSTQRRSYCTTGFVVTDGERTGVVTAAHCPDSLTYVSPEGDQVPLSFVGGWGALNQDVQVHVGASAIGPQFYADSRRASLRSVTGARPRASMRAGDIVCHRGETTGYSCAEVQLTDFAPPGELCGGPCDPVWVSVSGPGCRGGDSGGPVFVGNLAVGILKGATFGAGGRCLYYYFMSTDYLPDGWSLMTEARWRERTRRAPADGPQAP